MKVGRHLSSIVALLEKKRISYNSLSWTECFFYNYSLLGENENEIF